MRGERLGRGGKKNNSNKSRLDKAAELAPVASFGALGRTSTGTRPSSPLPQPFEREIHQPDVTPPAISPEKDDAGEISPPPPPENAWELILREKRPKHQTKEAGERGGVQELTLSLCRGPPHPGTPPPGDPPISHHRCPTSCRPSQMLRACPGKPPRPPISLCRPQHPAPPNLHRASPSPSQPPTGCPTLASLEIISQSCYKGRGESGWEVRGNANAGVSWDATGITPVNTHKMQNQFWQNWL